MPVAYQQGAEVALALFKLAEDGATQAPPPELLQHFQHYTSDLDAHGVFARTNHRRIIIPKTDLTEENVHSLGFKPVMIAVPEAGQDRFTSFRHPDNTLHIHSHGPNWTMHRDEHPAATMLMLSRPTLAGKAKALVEGIPHIITEGAPGLSIYLKRKAHQMLTGAKATMPSALT